MNQGVVKGRTYEDEIPHLPTVIFDLICLLKELARRLLAIIDNLHTDAYTCQKPRQHHLAGLVIFDKQDLNITITNTLFQIREYHLLRHGHSLR
jgi:hypothetical protein